MHLYRAVLAVALLWCLAARPVGAQTPKLPAAKPAAATPSPAVSNAPQQTTATYGDWTLRCSHPAGASSDCEVAQVVSNQDRPVAQIAFGRTAHSQPLHLTILVPPNVSLGSSPLLAVARDGEPSVVEFTWRRCLPGGCFADATIPDETLQRLRGWTEAARVTFADAAGHPAVLPFSPRGLSQALDALAKEES